MTGRPVVLPPQAPTRQVPVLAPPLPPVLVGAEAVDRWHYWRLFCAFGVLLAGTTFVAWQGLAAGWDRGVLAFWTGVSAAVWGAGLGWTHRAYTAALRVEKIARDAQAQKLTAELAEWQESLETERVMLQKWAEHEYGTKPPPQPAQTPTVTKQDAEEQQRAAFRRAVVADLLAEITPLLTQAQDDRARVAAPPKDDGHTNQLDMTRAPLLAAYEASPARTLVRLAWQGKSLANGAVTPTYLSDKAWRKAVPILVGVGVLRRDNDKAAPLLADDLKALDEAACHATVIDRLVAAGYGPSDLPGDLAPKTAHL